MGEMSLCSPLAIDGFMKDGIERVSVEVIRTFEQLKSLEGKPAEDLQVVCSAQNEL